MFGFVKEDWKSRRRRMQEYDLLCEPETEEEFQARMHEIADEDRAYEDMLEAQFELERQRAEEYDNAIFDPETDWCQGEIYAMSAE
jgi:hypothetical protein